MSVVESCSVRSPARLGGSGREAGRATRVREGARTRRTGWASSCLCRCLTRWGLGILRAGNGAHVVPCPGQRRAGVGSDPVGK
ncbi:hypothetical protein GQ55_2G250100 [Panicum hallii var. hallii]|uniref:Uncharacterized protein n=1 Tax=Panicum hallii var. hallii TaxID=1504633 RepID=A0A2T7ES35_9POAL|nr:hypothetical protein GQ55_2G250100 [Panicum hallii var. hallii]